MSDIHTPQFDLVRDYMRRHRAKPRDWDQIPPNIGSDDLARWLETQIEDQAWPDALTVDVWNHLKTSEKEAEERREEVIRIREEESDEATLGSVEDNTVHVPTGAQSCWKLFKRKLDRDPAFNDEDIEGLEDSVLKTLKRLKRTQDAVPIKGLIVGHVQSGKTTNMAALINMAADWGITVFIVLSGRIESLRKQTMGRLGRDLAGGGNLGWQQLDQLQPNGPYKPQNLHFNGNQRYFTVALKNPTRLKNLIGWLGSHADSLAQMKILIIDDESDEGGINTGDIADEDERTLINELILELVNIRAKAVNYVGYTATPFANVLNEGPGEQSLYPADFIRSLKSSNKYFGPREVFGIDGDENAQGLGTIRPITEKEKMIISDVQSGDDSQCGKAPSLKRAIAWFLCATAVQRLWGQNDKNHRQPSTMLVHTSQKQSHHSDLAEAIRSWLQDTPPAEILRLCAKVWARETRRFTLEDLRWQYPNYSLIDQVKNYPDFNEIDPFIRELIQDVSPILIEEQGQPIYHKGIHLCIDNCAQNGVNHEGEHVRLLYPDGGGENAPDYTTAFLVVGGATLSRGLTLKGLVSTYFLRTSSLGDSLLQMGRWFGYRIGYELLPRIWMTEDTRGKFRWLAYVEQSLREVLKAYEDAGASPSAYGPRIKVHPLVSWLRITARNRMQGARTAALDFAGITNQTTLFLDDQSWLDHNINEAGKFLRQLAVRPSLIRGAVVWKGVGFEIIKTLLFQMKFHDRNHVFGQAPAFIKWYEAVCAEAEFTDWNVIAAGHGEAFTAVPRGQNPAAWWEVPGGFVRKVNRSQKGRTRQDGSFSIGALLAPADRLADVPGELPVGGTPTLSEVRSSRTDARLDKTPILILYRIDKTSDYVGKAKDRYSLNVPSDVIGLALVIPGEQTPGSLVREVTVEVKEQDVDNGDIDDRPISRP